MKAHLLVSVALCASAAGGWPVDMYFDAEVGTPKFHRLSTVDWVEIEDAKVASAEILPSGELLIEGKAPGRTLLMLSADGRFALWRIRVRGASPSPGERELSAARAACPGLTTGQGEAGPSLSATIPDDRCRVQLAKVFETDLFRAAALELTFELPALQAQLAGIEQALSAIAPGKLRARYVGAGLVLEGRISKSQHRRVLWALFKNSVGRVALEDRIVLESEPPSP